MSCNDAAKSLIEAAKQIRNLSYSPYSQYKVGAAVMSPDGQLFTGANVENASYSLAICAERVAISQLLMAGQSKIEMLAIACDDAGTPCGACRQFMSEFGDDFDVLMFDTSTSRTTLINFAELFPNAFKLKME